MSAAEAEGAGRGSTSDSPRTWRERLRHAFAVDPPGPYEPSPEQQAAVDRLSREIARRHLTTPALAFLQMSQPLNMVGASAMHYFQPIVSAVMNTTEYQHFAAFLEHRGSIDYLCRRIEHFESEYEKRQE